MKPKLALVGASVLALGVLPCVHAQTIVVDGVRDSAYSAVRWSQTVPTGAGDNTQALMPAPGDPQNVVTGIEFKIPISALGNPANTTQIRVAGLVMSPDFTSASNQVVGSLMCDVPPLGSPRSIRLDQLGNPTNGKQFVTIQAGGALSPPVIDGTRDSSYGAPMFLQSASAAWGDSVDGQVDYAGASEIDAVYCIRTLTDVYLFVAGNLATDGSRLVLFFDSKSGGQSIIRGDNGYYALNIMGDDGSGNGLAFDGEFYTDYCLAFSGVDPDGPGPTPATFGVTYAEIPTLGGGRSFYCGSNTGGANVGGNLTGGQANAPAIKATIDNRNAAGVNTQTCDSVPSPDLAIGSEIDNLYSKVADGKLYIFIGGNLKTDGTVLDIFLDYDSGTGQNILRADNPPGATGLLASMAGLRFDAEFAADYWIGVRSVRTVNGYDLYADAAVLRAGGPRKNGSGYPLDYSAYTGGAKPMDDALWFDGPRIDAQTGTVPSLFTEYAPSNAGDSCLADPLNPVGTPGLLGVALNNSNVAGVGPFPGGATFLSTLVGTGTEIVIDLSELGWDGLGVYRIAGFITDPTGTIMSNQLLGTNPSKSQNLGPVSQADFATMLQRQYIIIGCVADLNQDGFVNGDDYDLFAEAFDSGFHGADFNHDGFVNGDDYDLFAEAFEEGC